jgi:hypothetical protein
MVKAHQVQAKIQKEKFNYPIDYYFIESKRKS